MRFHRRIQRLEEHFFDTNGLVTDSPEWHSHWEGKIDQLIAGENRIYADCHSQSPIQSSKAGDDAVIGINKALGRRSPAGPRPLPATGQKAGAEPYEAFQHLKR